MLRGEEDVGRLALPGTTGWTEAGSAGHQAALPDTHDLRRFLREKIGAMLRP